MGWRLTTKGDPEAVALYDRHYSRRPSSRGGLVAGPGRCLTLLRPKALWVSHYQRPELVKHAWPGAWTCTVFRNESPELSSKLILEAVAVTRHEWGDPPVRGLVTFVNARAVRSTNPGFCFLQAGFERLDETTKRAKLVVLWLPPHAFPPPKAPDSPDVSMFQSERPTA